MKKSGTTTLLIIFITLLVLFFLFGQVVSESVKYSLKTCYSSVIPSLFPLFIITEIIISLLASTSLNPTIYAYVSSLLSGFPGGTSSVCNLYNNAIINKKQSISLLYCTTNASPAFIISFIGICILKSKLIGIVILFAQIVSSIICVIIFKPFKTKVSSPQKIIYSDLITNSISKAIYSTLSICGYITFMGILADLMTYLKIDLFVSKIFFFIPAKIIRPIFIGLFEMTRGIAQIEINNMFSAVTASIIIGFSGISVILQCIKFTSESKLPSHPIIINKLVYVVCMPIITYSATKIINNSYKIQQKYNSKTTTLLLLIFLLLFIYFLFDKYVLKIYNREKR